MILEIEQFAALTENWDGYGASPFLTSTLRHAYVIARALRRDGRDVVLTPNANSTVDIEWTADGETYLLEVGNTRIAGCIKAE